VTSITARRRHPAARYAVVLLGLLLAGLIYAFVTDGAVAPAASAPGIALTAQLSQVSQGQAIFKEDCSSCHGLLGQGVPGIGPSLIGVGAAAVDFQVSTGRMPAKGPAADNQRKPPELTPQQTRAVAAYVASLGGGPAIPNEGQVSTSGANPGFGQQLFVADCAQCHNFNGAGGALTFGKSAPPLTASTPKQIYEAMLTGPESMPIFNNTTITPQEKRDIIAYVVQTRSEPNPGGFSLGRVGPVTEGLVAFLGLLLFVVFSAMWITAKHGKVHE
jgi:ubiquinol-cytochrome c reductase cytochrome c subunit